MKPAHLSWGRSLNPEDKGGLTADGRFGRTYTISGRDLPGQEERSYTLILTEPTLQGGKLTARIGTTFPSEEKAKHAALLYEEQCQREEE